MSGAVFHPGHEELHGITVVIEGASGRLYLGRYHEQGSRGIVLHDVAIHEPGSSMSREQWLLRQHKFGVAAEHRNLVVPVSEAFSIRRFSDAFPS
jgi:hypothetical protein